tara:strand:+ start:698 stop:1372 length:675 start_codon:yes stop_codon:yes gene_type:complete
MIVAIDGPAASGKSTTAIGVAKRLGITYLDTGAMYRAVTLGLIENNISFENSIELEKYLIQIKLEFSENKAGSLIFLNDVDVTKQIRSSIVTKNVSEVSALKIVREFMVDIQRKIAKNCDCILEGRDIGTVVFPKADFKFFLVADEKSRAKRRLGDLINAGTSKPIDVDDVLKDINNRDYKDSTRENSPLKKASDAKSIDTTYLTINEVIDKIVNIINNKRTLD